MLSSTQIETETDFLNPAQVEAKEAELEAKREKQRLEFMDDDKHEKYMRELFYEKERTELKGIPPAKDRIR